MEEQKAVSVFNKVGIAMCILVGFVLYSQILITGLAGFFKPDLLKNTTFLVGLSAVTYHVCAFPVYVFFMSTFGEKVSIEKRRLGFGRFVMFFFICFMVMNLTGYITVAFNAAVHALTGIELGSALDGIMEKPDGITVITTVVLAPIFEEFTFRYLALNKLRKYGDKTAIIVTALLFGLFHMNFEQAIYAAAIGLVLGYVACKTGHIIYTILLHAAVNFFSGVVPMLVETVEKPAVELAYTIGYVVFLLLGLILFIANVKKVKLRPSMVSVQHPVKKAIVNPGMLIYIMVCAGAMVLTLAAEFINAVLGK